MHTMSTEEWLAFVTRGAPTGRFATVGVDGTPTFAYVELRGDVTLTEDFGKRNAVPGEVVVRLRPTKVIAYGGITA
jgi:hypothetical protein